MFILFISLAIFMEDYKPKILVLSTMYISDLAVDLAGLQHKEYPPTTTIIRLPCSSMFRPEYALIALENGFDGVFIAADGTDCPFREDCTQLTARRVEEAMKLLKEHGYEPERIKMVAICSVCVKPFIRLINEFYERLRKLGPVKRR